MNKTQLAIPLLTVAMIIGCATAGPVLTPGEKATEPDRTSGPEPDWVTTSTVYKEDENKIFIRVEAQGIDRNFVNRVSLPAAATSVIASTIRTIAEAHLNQAIIGNGSELPGEAGRAILNAISRANYSSQIQEELYWERYPKKNARGEIEYEYEMYGWFSLTQDEFRNAKRRAWEEGIKGLSPADKEAKDLMEETADKFIQGVSR